MIVNDASSGVNKLKASLNDAARGVIYDCHVFIILATGFCWKIRKKSEERIFWVESWYPYSLLCRYAGCHYNIAMLGSCMLNVILPNSIIMNVVMQCHYAECCFAECRSAESILFWIFSQSLSTICSQNHNTIKLFSLICSCNNKLECFSSTKLCLSSLFKCLIKPSHGSQVTYIPPCLTH